MCNQQATSVVHKFRQDLETEIRNEMNTTFNNTYETKTVSECSSTVINSMRMNKLVIYNVKRFKMSNDAIATVKCKLQQASSAELKNDIATSLTSAIEKKLDASVLSKLEQETKSQMGSYAGNTQISDTNTDIEGKTTTNIQNLINTTINTNISNTAIMEARSTIINDFDFGEGVFAMQAEDVEITNLAKAFLESEVVSTAVTDVINKIANTQAVQEHIESKVKTETENKQKSSSGGFAEVIDSIGGVISSIFGGLFWFVPVIILLVFAGIAYKMSNSSQGPPPPGYGQPVPSSGPPGTGTPSPGGLESTAMAMIAKSKFAKSV